jgi:hypothetical protein
MPELKEIKISDWKFVSPPQVDKEEEKRETDTNYLMCYGAMIWHTIGFMGFINFREIMLFANELCTVLSLMIITLAAPNYDKITSNKFRALYTLWEAINAIMCYTYLIIDGRFTDMFKIIMMGNFPPLLVLAGWKLQDYKRSWSCIFVLTLILRTYFTYLYTKDRSDNLFYAFHYGADVISILYTALIAVMIWKRS